MKKSVTILLGAVCVCILAALLLQIKIISLENGESALVCTVPFGRRPGSSVRADLQSQLVPLYGEEGVQTERRHCRWQGEDATVFDTVSYEFEYLGQAVGGGDYLSCKVTTVRSVLYDGGTGAAIPDTSRTRVYIGYDDADLSSSERARVLWETETEDYSDSEDYFNGVIQS